MTLDANATLSIANTDGSIRVYAAEASEISIQAIKKAYTAERLKGIVVDVQGDPKNVAITHDVSRRERTRSAIVPARSITSSIVPQTVKITELELTNGEVLVEGLRGGSAKAHLVNGWIAGHNCFADLDLTVETGRLDVVYGWWENHKFAVKGFERLGASSARFFRAMRPSALNATARSSRPDRQRFRRTNETPSSARTSVRFG